MLTAIQEFLIKVFVMDDTQWGFTFDRDAQQDSHAVKLVPQETMSSIYGIQPQ